MTHLVLGAAMMADEIPSHIDWLRERDRDLEIQDFIFPQVLDAPGDTIAAARRALEGWQGRLGIHGPFFDLPLDAFDPEARALVQRRLIQSVEAAEALGATQMVSHSPFTTWGWGNDFLNGGREPIIERTRATLAPVLERAQAAGVTLVIENCEDMDPDDRVALVDALGGPLAVSLDVGHAHIAHVRHGGRPADWHVLAAGARLAHVHLQDVDGYADRHWAPGRGSVAWRAVFAALAEHAPGARLILELKDRRELPEGAAHLAGLGVAV